MPPGVCGTGVSACGLFQQHTNQGRASAFNSVEDAILFAIRELRMGSRVSALLFGMLSLAAASACAADLTFTLTSNNQSGSATNLPPDADPPCLQPNCVLFSGALTDTDTDLSFLFLQSLSVTFSSSNPSTGLLSLDNSFDFDVPGVLSGDPAYSTDNSGNPANAYSGPVFGIDIAPEHSPAFIPGPSLSMRRAAPAILVATDLSLRKALPLRLIQPHRS